MIILKIALPVILAILWRLGGMGAKPFGKNWRRIFAPAVYVLYVAAGVFLIKLPWWYLAGPAILFGATCLPVTLIGDDLNKKGQLFWWLPIFCLVHALSTVSLWGIPLAVIQWLMIFGSNKIDFPRWHIYEIAYGLLLGLAIVL